jgi:hypothetical protein
MKNIILQNFHWDQNFVFQLNRFQPEIIRDLLHLEILEEQLDSIFSVILYKKLSEPLLRLNNSLKKRKKREIFQQTICSVIIICVTRQNFLLGFTLTMLKTIKNKKNKINPVEYGFFWTENISEQGNIEIIYNKRIELYNDSYEYALFVAFFVVNFLTFFPLRSSGSFFSNFSGSLIWLNFSFLFIYLKHFESILKKKIKIIYL